MNASFGNTKTHVSTAKGVQLPRKHFVATTFLACQSLPTAQATFQDKIPVTSCQSPPHAFALHFGRCFVPSMMSRVVVAASDLLVLSS